MFTSHWSLHYTWRVENEELIITEVKYVTTNGEGYRYTTIKTVALTR